MYRKKNLTSWLWICVPLTFRYGKKVREQMNVHGPFLSIFCKYFYALKLSKSSALKFWIYAE